MPIRWGIIGCGDVVRKRVAAAIQEQASSELVAACQRDKEKLDEFCRTRNVARAYSNPAELIKDDEIDAIYIATPPHLHARDACAAAHAKKHVLVEKPMAMKCAECDEMINAARANNVVLGVAYYRRFYPAIARLRDLLADGTLGDPLAISAVVSNGFGLGPDSTSWRGEPNIAGGGALMDIGSHRIDLFVSLFGPAKRVEAMTSQTGASYQTENVASVLVEFERGVQATLQCFFETEKSLDQFRCVGTRGYVDIDNLNEGTLSVSTRERQWQESAPPASNYNAPLIDDFVAAIQTGKPPACDGVEGRETNRVMELAYQSAARERPSSLT